MPGSTPAPLVLILVLAASAPPGARAEGAVEAPGAATPTRPGPSPAPPGARPAEPGGSTSGADAAWRFARWGLSPEEVLAAFPGEAVRVAPPVNLADGNVIAAGVDALRWEGGVFDVRFVFQAGRLSLVSLRTRPREYAQAEQYLRLRDLLARRWGAPLEDARDDQFIDLRQARWDRGTFQVDLKYIPGVVALVLHPPPPR